MPVYIEFVEFLKLFVLQWFKFNGHRTNNFLIKSFWKEGRIKCFFNCYKYHSKNINNINSTKNSKNDGSRNEFIYWMRQI